MLHVNNMTPVLTINIMQAKQFSPNKARKCFTCECPEGYYGNDCKQPITSCHNYVNGSLRPGIYKVVDYDETMFEVYCHFDSDGHFDSDRKKSFFFLLTCDFA